MRLLTADDVEIRVSPGGTEGYLIELEVKCEEVDFAVYLRPEEWAALDGAIASFYEEYWRGRI